VILGRRRLDQEAEVHEDSVAWESGVVAGDADGDDADGDQIQSHARCYESGDDVSRP
jgi:hypothetical protein